VQLFLAHCAGSHRLIGPHRSTSPSLLSRKGGRWFVRWPSSPSRSSHVQNAVLYTMLPDVSLTLSWKAALSRTCQPCDHSCLLIKLLIKCNGISKANGDSRACLFHPRIETKSFFFILDMLPVPYYLLRRETAFWSESVLTSCTPWPPIPVLKMAAPAAITKATSNPPPASPTSHPSQTA
jgi:hypothetical protein